MEKEVIEEKAGRKTGVEEINKKQFAYYPEDVIEFDGIEIDYFHFKKPSVEKAEAHNVVLSNEMSIKNLRNLSRACLLRVVKVSGSELPSTMLNKVLSALDVDDLIEMGNRCSVFFVKGAE